MSETAEPDLTARIAEESASLPPEKQNAVLDFIRFAKYLDDQGEPLSDGEAAWERIINDPRPRPKLQEFLRRSAAEGGEEPLDPDRL